MNIRNIEQRRTKLIPEILAMKKIGVIDSKEKRDRWTCLNVRP
jgi:hypothetical protein